MKTALFIVLVFLAGCASHKETVKKPVFVAPTVNKVVAPVQSAKAIVERLNAKPGAFSPDVSKDLIDITGFLTNAESFAGELQLDINKQTIILNDTIAQRDAAQAQVEYWHGKHIKGLKEIWFHRSIWIMILSAVTILVLIKLGIIGAKIIS